MIKDKLLNNDNFDSTYIFNKLNWILESVFGVSFLPLRGEFGGGVQNFTLMKGASYISFHRHDFIHCP